jgi:hypothetical protein
MRRTAADVLLAAALCSAVIACSRESPGGRDLVAPSERSAVPAPDVREPDDPPPADPSVPTEKLRE